MFDYISTFRFTVPVNRRLAGTALRRRCLVLSAALLTMVFIAFVSPALAINESGGIITYDGDYIIHTFYSSDTLTPALGVTEVEVLVVAGGGGGGGGNGNNRSGGGGGAGGLVYNAAYPVGASVGVTVGAGGAGGAANTIGTNGTDSAFDSLTAVGGGGGGSGNTSGSVGGSGGGGGAANSANIINGGAGVAGQGNAGGYGQSRKAGGGGGGGTTGGNASATSAGNGGDGSYYSQFTLAGVGGWFAGGGGGGANGTGNTAGTGGTGGGGTGGDPGTAGGSATANTGGGGGGGATTGGNGGSGIVIVRYILPAIAIAVYGDVSLAIGPDIIIAGQGQTSDTDSSATLNWTSVAAPGDYNKISVRILGGTLPDGLQLSINTPLADGPVVLNATDQDLVTNIENESQTDQILTYTLTVTDCAALFVNTETLTIEYTITAQP